MPSARNNYETAYDEAVLELKKLGIHHVSECSGARVIEISGSEYLLLRFIDEDVRVSFPDISVQYADRNDSVQLWYKILILHYLIQAKGTRPSGNQITFKQIPGGLAYYPAFRRRSIEPIIKNFRSDFNRFISAGEKIGGFRAGHGDYSLSFNAFPRVSLTCVIWKESEEFPPDANIIFDSSITDYLTTEDIVVLCNIISVKILKTDR